MSGVRQNRSLIFGALFLAVAIAAIAWAYVARRAQHHSGPASPTSSSVAPASSGSDATSYSADTARPSDPGSTRTQVPVGQTPSEEQQNVDKNSDPALNYGSVMPVKGDANEDVRSVVQALQNGQSPERISALVQSKRPFDSAAYKANPSAYLRVIEPSRVFQPAEPKKGTPRIQALLPELQNVRQGQTVKLRVKAAPGYPVSYTSFQLGRFANQLSSISVEANEVGLSEVDFTATEGTINEIQILAASPVCSGQAKFTVNVAKAQ